MTPTTARTTPKTHRRVRPITGYSTLLFDLDHTLLDSDESERAAYAHTMGTIDLSDPHDYFERYVEINQSMWRSVEKGELQPIDVRYQRFERFVSEVGIDADPHAMGDAFVWALGAYGELYEGARDLLEQVASTASLGMVTNGLSDVQRSRVERLDLGGYFDSIVISSEVGVTKPRPGIFDIAFEQLGQPAKGSVLMIGDSLTSDMRGGADYGIDTCWFNPHQKQAEPADIVTHEVSRLSEINALL